MKKTVKRVSRIPRGAKVDFTPAKEQDGPKDDVRSSYDFDYAKARPNRFAGRVKFTRGGARKGAGRKPAPEPLVSKHVYLAARHIKILQRVDTNLSAAIHKLAEATQIK